MKHFRIKQTSNTELKITGSDNTPLQRSQKQQQEEPKDASGSDVRIKKTSKTAGLSIARVAPSTSGSITEDRRSKTPSITGLSIARIASSTSEPTAKDIRNKKKRKSVGAGIGIVGTSGTRGPAADQEDARRGGNPNSNEPHEKSGISIWGTAPPQKKKQKTDQIQIKSKRADKKEPSNVERATKRRSIFGYQMQRALQQNASQEHVGALASNGTSDEDGEIHMGVEIKSSSKKKNQRKPI
ncbi:hypothetical protein GGI23_002231 [Coemansia sp. RSA 2559]|nr:hypothetical protein GGI23_002231 [Coemansia sp. RSA 2559]KAJ2869306.1 hypothetical protein GGI22_000337 [Coemansia erecta]